MQQGVKESPGSPQLIDFTRTCGYENQRYYQDYSVLDSLKAAKGTGVHRLKGDASWVQNGVSQFGLYLLEVLLPERKEG